MTRNHLSLIMDSIASLCHSNGLLCLYTITHRLHVVVRTAIHQSSDSDCQETRNPNASREGMLIHLLLRLSIPVLQILHPILRHLRNIEECRCAVIYEVYCVFVHNM